jgi:hypothetical protein
MLDDFEPHHVMLLSCVVNSAKLHLKPVWTPGFLVIQFISHLQGVLDLINCSNPLLRQFPPAELLISQPWESSITQALLLARASLPA